MKTHYIIGCGGVGSWLAPSLSLLVGKSDIRLVDGDTLEEKNLNRQLFDTESIGHNKAERLAWMHGCGGWLTDYYQFGLVEHEKTDWLFVCVDNNAARLAALRACDHFGCKAIFAANETTSSEAYFYSPLWKNTQLDPRVYYPQIETDNNNDPMRPAGCTGDAQTNNPQLVSANFSAAALAQNLYILWGMNASNIDAELLPRMPYMYRQNLSGMEAIKIGDKNKQQKERTVAV